MWVLEASATTANDQDYYNDPDTSAAAKPFSANTCTISSHNITSWEGVNIAYDLARHRLLLRNVFLLEQ
jgi:hypothetical protein